MKFDIKKFDELTPTELYQILQLRNEVFVVEQNVVYQDADGKDYKALHVFLKDNNRIISYIRICKPGDYFKNACIGRVVTHPSYRRRGIGYKIVQKGIDIITQEMKADTIEISAQKYLLQFYNDLGFKEEGEEYLEDGLPHFRMFYRKNQNKISHPAGTGF